MDAAAEPRTYVPSADHADDIRELLDSLELPGQLVRPEGGSVDLPREVYDVLRAVLDAMAQGLAVQVVPQAMTLTTQQAADLLGVSRPTFVAALERGDLAYERPGRHRRVRLQEVLEYQKRIRSQRRAQLDELDVDVTDDVSMNEAVRLSRDLRGRRRADQDLGPTGT